MTSPEVCAGRAKREMGRDRAHEGALKCDLSPGLLRILPLPQRTIQFFPAKTTVMSCTC